MILRVNPNRMELLKLRRRLVLARRGHKLLKDKQEELMRQFMALIHEAKQARKEVEQSLTIANKSFFSARLETLEPQIEKHVAMLAAELERTRRRVNALEHILIPNLEETIKYIGSKLNELERGNITRLMKIKDIVRSH